MLEKNTKNLCHLMRNLWIETARDDIGKAGLFDEGARRHHLADDGGKLIYLPVQAHTPFLALWSTGEQLEGLSFGLRPITLRMLKAVEERIEVDAEDRT